MDAPAVDWTGDFVAEELHISEQACARFAVKGRTFRLFHEPFHQAGQIGHGLFVFAGFGGEAEVELEAVFDQVNAVRGDARGGEHRRIVSDH